jgi:flagellar FliL protein
MATTPPIIQAKITSDSVKLPIMPLLAAVVLGVVVSSAAVGGFIYYMLRSGKLPIRTIATPAAPAAQPAKTHMTTLEPLLVNLADASGTSFLKIGLTLEVADPDEKTAKEAKGEGAKPAGHEADAAVRDTALTVLGRETSEQLLAPGGKELLKKELKEALAARHPEIKVADLFFTEFLVQR